MSEDHDIPENYEELESLLGRLIPTQLEEAQITKLNRIQERIMGDRNAAYAEMPWSRVVPLMLLSLAMMCVFGIQHYRSALSKNTSQEARLVDASSLESVNPLPSQSALPPEAFPPPASHFIPAPTYGTVVKTSSEGMIESENDPLQRFKIEYHDGLPRYESESNARIRYFHPRSEDGFTPFPSY